MKHIVGVDGNYTSFRGCLKTIIENIKTIKLKHKLK